MQHWLFSNLLRSTSRLFTEIIKLMSTSVAKCLVVLLLSVVSKMSRQGRAFRSRTWMLGAIPITPVPEDILWSYTKRELILIYGNVFSQRGLLTSGICWMKILSLRTLLTVSKDIYKGCTRMGHSQDWASLHDPSGRARSLGRPKLVRYWGRSPFSHLSYPNPNLS